MFAVQHECIPQAVLGMDILCQAKSGMGKTAVFVLATLQQLEATDNQVYVLVMCHTRELAFQISKEYERFSKYMPQIKVNTCYCIYIVGSSLYVKCHLYSRMLIT